MSPLNDPIAVAEQYAREDNLRARQAIYEEMDGRDPWDVVWELITALEPRNVIEVGGGPGELAERLQKDLQATVTMLDISPRMVELATERGVDARVGDVQDLPFPDTSFDTAIAAWMLYHVPDIDRGLAELARVLQPGGSLVAVTNSVTHLRELRELIDYPARNVELFSRENGEGYLERHFGRVECHDVDGVVTVRDREKLVGYRDSISFEVGPVPEDVAMPFLITRRQTIFVATK